MECKIIEEIHKQVEKIDQKIPNLLKFGILYLWKGQK